MRIHNLSLTFFGLICFALVMLTGQTAAADVSPYKQLSAPPEEFAAMALPSNLEQGVRSHSAMVPVELVNGQWQGELFIESAESVKLMTFSNGADWQMQLQSDSGESRSLSANSRSAQQGAFGMANNSFDGTVYTMESLEAGRWTVTLTGDATRGTQQGMLLYANADAVTKQYSHLTSYRMLAGEPVGLRTFAFEDGSESGTPSGMADRIDVATVSLTHPDGSVTTHGMTAAVDGSYAFDWQSLPAGTYTAQVMVSGVNSAGERFQRTSEHLMPILDETVSLAANADSAVLDANRLQFNLPIADAVDSTFMVSAEVWGTRNGADVPVAWIGGLNDVVANSLPISVDGHWIARAAAEAPFSLRNVRLQDVDTFIPVAEMAQIDLVVDALPDSVNSRSTDITTEMLMGARPERAASRSGGKLMLVHGYCSGDVWDGGDFTNDIEFQDFDQNRTHDEFANEILSFGASYPSYNIVAHSQGGTASLHLYTYYWSGLDYAVTSRLVQSVGTPYQGTSLAGNLALLGNIFGVGCGTNFDLTYDGASLWLANIPSWARDDVWFATTTYTDKWWRPDWCNIASSAVLGGLDDGTTQQSKGQLSGANNMGNKSGWCHTEMMRDPAQTTDSARNAMMDSFGDSRSNEGATTPKIVVDGSFDDWFSAGSIEHCISANGALSSQCVTSNQFSHLYFKSTAVGAGSVCTNIDTDADAQTNYQLCYAGDAMNSAEAITLQSCDSNACTEAETVATYPAAGFDAASNTVEMGVGLADLGLTVGDSVCFNTAAGSQVLPSADTNLCYNTATGATSTMIVQAPTAVTTSGQSANSISATLALSLATVLLALSAFAWQRRD